MIREGHAKALYEALLFADTESTRLEIILAYDDAIRMNCACRAGLYIESVHKLDGYHIDPDMLEAAILGEDAEK